MDYRVSDDLATVKEIRDCSTADLALQLKVGSATLERWLSEAVTPSATKIEQFYDYAYNEGIDLNQIKAQLYREMTEAEKRTLLFHGSKSSIDGPLSLKVSRPYNDFGIGFYCGQSLEQSATFVAGYGEGSLYMLSFDSTGLTERSFVVDQEWMLAIAWYRGWLTDYRDHPVIARARTMVEDADYIIAPIADNRMYEIVNEFIDGLITDVQCQHCLAATNLGNQYVFTTVRSLGQVYVLEHCYLSDSEKKALLSRKSQSNKVGRDKAKVAMRRFRGQGLYIEEILS